LDYFATPSLTITDPLTFYETINSYTSHKLLRLMEADGLEEIETGDGNADSGDYYVAGKTFGPATTPNSNRYSGTQTDILVSNISASGNPMSFDLSLPASGPEMNVKKGSAAIPDNTGSYNFGNVSLGSYQDATFTIENTGSSDLNLTGVPAVSIGGTHSGDFVVTTDPAPPVSAGDPRPS